MYFLQIITLKYVFLKKIIHQIKRFTFKNLTKGYLKFQFYIFLKLMFLLSFLILTKLYSMQDFIVSKNE